MTDLLKWTALQPGDRITSDSGRFGGVVLATCEACDVVGRAQIHWDDGEITWIRPDLLAIEKEVDETWDYMTELLEAAEIDFGDFRHQMRSVGYSDEQINEAMSLCSVRVDHGTAKTRVLREMRAP